MPDVLPATIEDIYQAEVTDAVLCAFGPEYFRGIRDAAAVGSALSFLFSRRCYVSVRSQLMQSLASATAQVQKPRCRRVISYGLRLHPLKITGAGAGALTGSMKLVKFYFASGRVNEFLLDDLHFEELSRIMSRDKEAADVFEKYCEESAKEFAASTLTEKNKHSSLAMTTREPKTALAATLALATYNAQRDYSAGDFTKRRSPTYRDGVAVGLLGSMVDAHIPVKPVSAYYDMRFGYF